MFNALFERLRQRHRTIIFPADSRVLPERFRGFPGMDGGRCPADCDKCAKVCPTGAVATGRDGLRIDLGKCLFCGDCASACPAGAIRFAREYRMAVSRREDLLADGRVYRLARKLENKSFAMFGRSLRLREVSAGGCGACEADVAVLNTVVFDLARFGVQFVASPRHADGLLVTGPVSANMDLALRKTWDAVPAPKIVVAVGACAISGGPYAGNPEVHDGVGGILPVDLYIPGCPPHPLTTLDGLLRMLGRIKSGESGRKETL